MVFVWAFQARKVSHAHHGLLDGLLPWDRGLGRREPHQIAGSVLGDKKSHLVTTENTRHVVKSLVFWLDFSVANLAGVAVSCR